MVIVTETGVKIGEGEGKRKGESSIHLSIHCRRET